jgi:AcrR family transcriptional regulator
MAATKKAERTRANEVLDAAAAILVEDGYAGLTFRGVAQRVGIGIGNLQHYFPTKEDLIRSMLARAMDSFTRAMEQRRTERRGSDARQDFEAAIAYILYDQTRRESCVIFWELWALASHDRNAARVMSEFYDSYVKNIASLIRDIRPDVTKQRAERAGIIIAALIEGASLFRGHGRPRTQAHVGLDKRLRETVFSIVESA